MEHKNTAIKKARLEKGYSQMNVASILGVSLLTYIQWEKGTTRNPHPENKQKLEELLDLKFGENGPEQIVKEQPMRRKKA